MTQFQLLRRRLFRHHLAMVSASILALLVVFSFSAPLLEFILGTESSSVDLFSRFQPFSFAHPLGTDELGRD